MGIFILYTRRKSKIRRFFFKFSGNLKKNSLLYTCVCVYVEKPEKVYLLYLCLQNEAALFNC